MDFVKLQATGNDFVLVEGREYERDWSELARAVCSRRLGVGSDGLIVIAASESADLGIRMFNPDGSEAEACGNGLRCLARWASESGAVTKSEFTVETPVGLRTVQLLDSSIRVSMGAPVLSRELIPVAAEAERGPVDGPLVNLQIDAGGASLSVDCLSMGNPHAVFFQQEPIDSYPLAEVGPRVERHPAFPRRTNFEIVNIINRSKLGVRVWERGAGETLSCGSGACAAVVASIRKGLCEDTVDVALRGGTVTVDWDGTGEVHLSGPAEVVFTGKWPD